MFFITSLKWGRETGESGGTGRGKDEDVWGTGWGTKQVEKIRIYSGIARWRERDSRSK